jgi:hypothetical protein
MSRFVLDAFVRSAWLCAAYVKFTFTLVGHCAQRCHIPYKKFQSNIIKLVGGSAIYYSGRAMFGHLLFIRQI